MSKSDPLDRPATPEEIEIVERLLKQTRRAEMVPPPQVRSVRKSSPEVLPFPVIPLLSPIRRGRSHFDFSESSGPGAVVLQFVDRTKPVWLRSPDRRQVREGDRPEKPPRSRRGDHG